MGQRSKNHRPKSSGAKRKLLEEKWQRQLDPSKLSPEQLDEAKAFLEQAAAKLEAERARKRAQQRLPPCTCHIKGQQCFWHTPICSKITRS